MDKWDKLYIFISDWAFAIAPDERCSKTEYELRENKYKLLLQILQIMEDIEDAYQIR